MDEATLAAVTRSEATLDDVLRAERNVAERCGTERTARWSATARIDVV